jgi:hypothetical protein
MSDEIYSLQSFERQSNLWLEHMGSFRLSAVDQG